MVGEVVSLICALMGNLVTREGQEGGWGVSSRSKQGMHMRLQNRMQRVIKQSAIDASGILEGASESSPQKLPWSMRSLMASSTWGVRSVKRWSPVAGSKPSEPANSCHSWSKAALRAVGSGIMRLVTLAQYCGPFLSSASCPMAYLLLPV